MPIVAIISPKIVESMPFAGEAPVSDDTAVMAKTISVKYSAGPNLSAIDVSGSANSVSATTPIEPAMNEPIARNGKRGAGASVLRHLVAVDDVMTEAASPGVRIRMDVVDPPYFVP